MGPGTGGRPSPPGPCPAESPCTQGPCHHRPPHPSSDRPRTLLPQAAQGEGHSPTYPSAACKGGPSFVKLTLSLLHNYLLRWLPTIFVQLINQTWWCVQLFVKQLRGLKNRRGFGMENQASLEAGKPKPRVARRDSEVTGSAEMT